LEGDSGTVREGLADVEAERETGFAGLAAGKVDGVLGGSIDLCFPPPYFASRVLCELVDSI